MKESLGLNISNNFIRYAKIQNDGNKIKVKAWESKCMMVIQKQS